MGYKILDPACGSKMFWFDKSNQETLFGDIRNESHVLCDGRSLHITPDVVMNYENIPLPAQHFDMIIFDPPHLERAGENSWMRKKYGVLPEEWPQSLRKGFSECFRVLKNNGVLIFKWNNNQVPVGKILSLTPYAPLFGQRRPNRKSSTTHWITFLKTEGSK